MKEEIGEAEEKNKIKLKIYFIKSFTITQIHNEPQIFTRRI